MSVNVLYQTAARATGGRDGRAATISCDQSEGDQNGFRREQEGKVSFCDPKQTFKTGLLAKPAMQTLRAS